MADDFSRAQWLWLKQVQRDAKIPHRCFRLAFILCTHANREIFIKRKILEAWPGQKTLASFDVTGTTCERCSISCKPESTGARSAGDFRARSRSCVTGSASLSLSSRA